MTGAGSVAALAICASPAMAATTHGNTARQATAVPSEAGVWYEYVQFPYNVEGLLGCEAEGGADVYLGESMAYACEEEGVVPNRTWALWLETI